MAASFGAYDDDRDEDDDDETPKVMNKYPDLRAATLAKGAVLIQRPFFEPPPEYDMIKSIDELMEKCRIAKKEQWIQQYSLARIRCKLGLPIKKDSMTPQQMEKLKLLFVAFIKSLMEKKKDSPYFKVLLDSTKEQPDESIVMLQFLYFSNANTTDRDFVRIADLIAKEPHLGKWCRSVLKDPSNHHDAVIECVLGHLERFIYIVSPKEKKEFLTSVILCGAQDEKEGLSQLRKHLLSFLKQADDGTRGITVAHSVYFHNLVELALCGKYDSPMPEELQNAWKTALHCRMAEFPPKQYWQTVSQTYPYCEHLFCLKRGPFVCCEHASYCSRDCRESDWERHHNKTICAHGTTKKEIDWTPLGERPDDPVPEVLLP